MARTDLPIYFRARKSPLPSSISKAFSNLTPRDVQLIKGILKGEVDLMAFEAAFKRQAEAYNSHEPLTLALEAVNEILGAYGVEYVAHKNDGYTTSSLEGFYYFNFGDTYDTTILVSAQGQNWVIGSWGDRVEANPGKYV